ncbi:hypothetical protein [Agromyces marinus]
MSVVVGMRTPEQVHGTAARFEAQIPDAFWEALTRRGLLRDA